VKVGSSHLAHADGVPALASPPVPGRRNPSRPARRLPVVLLALAGCAVSTYLTLYQVHAIHSVWDPFFGSGSERVLTSSLSRSLPVPDALLGAVAYAVEAVLEMSGRRDRWRTQGWLVVLVGLVSAALAITGVVLVISQPVLTGTFCTLCLTSAVLSWLIAAGVAGEVVATLASFRPAPR
jgi:uncharacterized membrane protein